MDCLKYFERWSRHEELLPYVKVLESWDDKVCDEWEPPDENSLNCDEWLNGKEEYQLQSYLVENELQKAFVNVDIFFERINPYLI